MKIEYLADNKWSIPIVAKTVYDNMVLFRDNEYIETMVTKYNKLANNKESIPFTLIAFEEQGQILGTVSIVNEDVPVEFAKASWLAALYVDNAYRRKGIATMLVKKTIVRF
jgi:GNAT superfamily N-acetyltransferase